jgi:hypothetical protein
MRFGIAADDLDGVVMGAPEEMGDRRAGCAPIGDRHNRSDTWFIHVLQLQKNC